MPFNPDNFMKSASNSVRYVILPADCKRHHHDWDDPQGSWAGGRAHVVSIHGVAVSSASDLGSGNGQPGAPAVAAALLLGLVVTGAVPFLTTRRGATNRRGPTAD